MNVYGAIVLAALLVDFGLTVVAKLLNLRALRGELPEELRDVYDAEEYRRSQDYTRVQTRFGLVTATFDTAAILVFWFAGGFAWLDAVLRSFGLSSIVTGLLYIGVLVLGKMALSLPFDIYSTFVIEERFGFNRTTAKVFVLDIVKGLVVAVLLGAPILAAILYFFERMGGGAWLYAWVLTVVFSLFIQVITPTWILPLFNKFDPLPEGDLHEALSNYAEKVGFALSGIFVIDGSRRSSRANAYFTGLGKNKRIALFDTLIEKHTVPELVAVLAHEVGHYKKKHVLKGLALSIVHSGVMLYLLGIFLEHQGLFSAFYLEERSVYAGFVFFGLLYAPIELVLQLFLNLLSRSHEYEADRYAAETFSAEAMIRALKKISADHLQNLTPHPFYVALRYSHPPTLERIRALAAST